MPKYLFEALKDNGKPVKGSIEAANSDEAIARIRSQGYFPTSVRQEKKQKKKKQKQQKKTNIELDINALRGDVDKVVGDLRKAFNFDNVPDSYKENSYEKSYEKSYKKNSYEKSYKKKAQEGEARDSTNSANVAEAATKIFFYMMVVFVPLGLILNAMSLNKSASFSVGGISMLLVGGFAFYMYMKFYKAQFDIRTEPYKKVSDTEIRKLIDAEIDKIKATVDKVQPQSNIEKQSKIHDKIALHSGVIIGLALALSRKDEFTPEEPPADPPTEESKDDASTNASAETNIEHETSKV